MIQSFTSLYRASREPSCTGKARSALVWSLAVTAICLTGCPSRQLTLEHGPVINNAGRSPGQQGVPLEVTIVCVYPKDLASERSENHALRPDAGITSAVWFERCPQPGDSVESESLGGRFRIPADQVFWLTDDKEERYGKKLGPALKGTGTNREVDIRFPISGWHIHDDHSVIYVFGRFQHLGDPRKPVLPVPPAKFHPPGKYPKGIRVRVGVREDGGGDPSHHGQFIEVVAVPK